MHFVEAKSLLTKWNGMNVYRGCTHGCIYCDSRSDCYHFSHPFEDIEVKQNAPALLEAILRTKKNRIMISSGSMCDPYQPCEKELKLTRACLELIYQYGFGATVITKSDLVLRDLALFAAIHERAKSVVQMSLTCVDETLSSILEPNVCNTLRRCAVLKEFQKAKIPTVVWMSPLLPFLTDTAENVNALLDRCFDAGVKGIVCFDIGMTLRDGSRDYYYDQLDRRFPGLSEQYRKKYGGSYQVESDRSKALMALFHERCEKQGILHTPDDCFAYIRALPDPNPQLQFF